MFRKSTQENSSSTDNMTPTHPKEVCAIAAGTEITGDVKLSANIRLEGIIKGNITCEGRIVMSKTAAIIGDVKCKSLLCEGKIEGNVVATGDVRLLSTASLTGDLKCAGIHIEQGAAFNGCCQSNPK